MFFRAGTRSVSKTYNNIKKAVERLLFCDLAIYNEIMIRLSARIIKISF